MGKSRNPLTGSFKTLGLAIAGVYVGFSGLAHAGYSTVTGNQADPTSQSMILAHVYGGTFTSLPDQVSYSNGTISAVRVSDTLPGAGVTANPGPNNTDQLWQDNAVFADAKAIFAEENTSFGYVPGASGGTYQELFNVTGSQYNVSGSGSLPSPAGTTFRWAAENPFGVETSLPSDNLDGKDHMVTYEIEGLNDNFTTWMLFFDDYGNDGHDPDFDYQDLVVELKTIPASSPVPEPGTLMMGAGAGMLLLRRWRSPA